jgi:hypothetical protein
MQVRSVHGGAFVVKLAGHLEADAGRGVSDDDGLPVEPVDHGVSFEVRAGYLPDHRP